MIVSVRNLFILHNIIIVVVYPSNSIIFRIRSVSYTFKLNWVLFYKIWPIFKPKPIYESYLILWFCVDCRVYVNFCKRSVYLYVSKWMYPCLLRFEWHIITFHLWNDKVSTNGQWILVISFLPSTFPIHDSYVMDFVELLMFFFLVFRILNDFPRILGKKRGDVFLYHGKKNRNLIAVTFVAS